MPKTQITSYEEVYVLCKKMANRYSMGRKSYLLGIELTTDDLASEVMLRLLKYNTRLLDYPSIDSTLLCHVVFRHIYYVANTYAKRKRREMEFIAAKMNFQPRASPTYTPYMFESDFNDLLNAIKVKSQVERELVDLLKNPDDYWKWTAMQQTSCSMPSVRRLAAYLKSSAYKVRLAIAHISKEIQCEYLL